MVVQTDVFARKRLLAYIVPSEESIEQFFVLTHELYALLRKHLPPYMLPSAILPLPALPLTSTGKLDRNALPFATRVPRSLESEYVAPRNLREAQLVELWNETLSIEPIGVYDDFFELVDTRLWLRSSSERSRISWKIEFSAGILYLQPTIAELALALEAVAEESNLEGVAE